MPDEYVEEIERVADERGLRRTQFLRHLIYAGWRVDQKLDINLDTESETIDTGITDPFEEIFVSALPESESESIGLDELRDSIKQQVDTEVQRLFREYDGLEYSDGGIYHE